MKNDKDTETCGTDETVARKNVNANVSNNARLGDEGARVTANVNFKYKDTVFRMLFSDKANLLSLYNAMNKTRCDNLDELRVVTLENAIYMEVKNDIAFLLGDCLHLYEHQSTRNPNLPLRFLQYIAAEYQKLIETEKKNLYSRSLIKLPAPKFVVFYNGTEDTKDHETMRLSSAFARAEENANNEKSKLELEVDVYNINAGRNKAILNACETLKNYAEFVRRIRENQKTMSFESAVKKAVDDCIRDGILEDFLRANRSEVLGMSIFEFDREEYLNMVRTEEYEEGKAEGAYDKAVATAKNFIAMGVLTIEQIAQGTGLSVEEVAAL